ncbi:hypothetical protein KP003_09380 [Geomonas nitrogeniifigens]|uniref:hypothetical protein n=1 Tax=Geomonas diazotrophica TaxID=2843197 RepID=UPI001C2BF67F|nr:hypothetical protein [Geomonas nitrogeniifigens]QXE88587.1 hypothetical protein KP003_09380 [Geomonas nitrogeniifigens]
MAKICILLICICIFLSGCSNTRVIGHKTANIAGPIHEIVVVLDNKTFKAREKSDQAYINTVNSTMKKVYAVVHKRIPEVFAQNGIKAKAYLNVDESSGEPATLPPMQLKEFPYLLTITPSNASIRKQDGNTNIDMAAHIYDQFQEKIVWRGSITYSESSYALINDKTADVFLDRILNRLRDVGFVSLKPDDTLRVSAADPPNAPNLTTSSEAGPKSETACSKAIIWMKENNKWGPNAPIVQSFQKQFDSGIGKSKVVWEVGKGLTKDGKDYRIECINDNLNIKELTAEEADKRHVKDTSVKFWSK